MQPTDPEGIIRSGRPPAPGWFLRMTLGPLSDEAVARIRDQAVSSINQLADSGHPLAEYAFQVVFEAAARRLGQMPDAHTQLVPNLQWMQIPSDPDEAPSTTQAERLFAVAIAEPFLADANPEVAGAWREWTESFAEEHFMAT